MKHQYFAGVIKIFFHLEVEAIGVFRNYCQAAVFTAYLAKREEAKQ